MPLTFPSRVAIHEAGHAVVHLTRGHAVHAITAVPDEERGSLGHVLHEQTIERRMRAEEPDWCGMAAEGVPQEEIGRRMEEWDRLTGDDVPGQAAACVAGEVAERIAFGSAEPEGLGGDYAALADLCLHAGGPDDEARQRIQADALALAEKILSERWPGVVSLAHALDERKTLTGAEAEEELRRADENRGAE
jgi:hypothetical protein